MEQSRNEPVHRRVGVTFLRAQKSRPEGRLVVGTLLDVVELDVVENVLSFFQLGQVCLNVKVR
jgi:hypothetical protein